MSITSGDFLPLVGKNKHLRTGSGQWRTVVISPISSNLFYPQYKAHVVKSEEGM